MPENKKIPLTKTERMRRYRAKLKTDAERRTKALEADRLRKKRERLSMRESLNSRTPKEIERVRTKKREEMREYRQRKRDSLRKEQLEICSEEQKKALSARDRERKKKDKKRKQEKREAEREHRKQAVEATKQWRLRVKLKASEGTEDSGEEDSLDNSFGSRWTERCEEKRVREVLPKTPEKRAQLLGIQSPRSSKILAKKGLVLREKCL